MSGHESNVYFGLSAMWVSTVILAATYAIIMSEKINRAIIALIGASVMILVGWSTEEVAPSWTQVEVAGRLESPYAMPFETSSPIHVCRGLKVPLEMAWRRAKMFI